MFSPRRDVTSKVGLLNLYHTDLLNVSSSSSVELYFQHCDSCDKCPCEEGDKSEHCDDCKVRRDVPI